MRPPPRSPLFPYTTLFRSRRCSARCPDRRARPASPPAAAARAGRPRGPPPRRRRGRAAGVRAGVAAAPRRWRSEEHTSELQSRLHLVCRLLLEKKKNNNKFTSQQKHKSNTPKFTPFTPHTRKET